MKNKYAKIAFDGLITNNASFKLVLGTCAALGMSSSAIGGFGMGISVTVVLLLSNVLISMLRKVIPSAVRIPAFVVIIATLVTLLRMALEKYMPDLYDSMGVFLPLITTNCAVLGVAMNNITDGDNFGFSLVSGFFTAIGFLISITILAGIRERIEHNDIPESFKGTPIVLVTASLMAIAFCGFAGIV